MGILSKEYAGRTARSLIINSLTIKEDLAKLGVRPNKSLTIEFPSVPLEFMPSFIRGIIDDDGHVQSTGYTVTITSGSEKFSKALHDVFISWGV